MRIEVERKRKFRVGYFFVVALPVLVMALIIWGAIVLATASRDGRPKQPLPSVQETTEEGTTPPPTGYRRDYVRESELAGTSTAIRDTLNLTDLGLTKYVTGTVNEETVQFLPEDAIAFLEKLCDYDVTMYFAGLDPKAPETGRMLSQYEIRYYDTTAFYNRNCIVDIVVAHYDYGYYVGVQKGASDPMYAELTTSLWISPEDTDKLDALMEQLNEMRITD